MRFQLFIFNIPSVVCVLFALVICQKLIYIYITDVSLETINVNKKHEPNSKHANQHDDQDDSVKNACTILHSLFWMFVYYFIFVPFHLFIRRCGVFSLFFSIIEFATKSNHKFIMDCFYFIVPDYLSHSILFCVELWVFKTHIDLWMPITYNIICMNLNQTNFFKHAYINTIASRTKRGKYTEKKYKFCRYKW